MITAKATEKGYFIGLMSGTSVDAIDAVLVQFTDPIPNARHHVLARHVHPIPRQVRHDLVGLTQAGGINELDRLARLDNAVARLFAEAVYTLLQKSHWPASNVVAIGSHGQTVRHAPTDTERYTLQIGNPSLLAELTGITTVADFRRRDLAADGQGAPLAPAFHRAFLQHPTETRVVINIGGMANITVLPPAADEAVITGFDTGPGNVLLDIWAHRHLGVLMDRDGAWGQKGKIVPELLTHCLRDPYFALPPPKSTGREYFNETWLDRQMAVIKSYHPVVRDEDVQATWAELTVQTIVNAVQQTAPAVDRMLVCGGGVHNPLLMVRLQTHMIPVPVESTAAHGIDPDFMEAVGFAWLARQTMHGLPGNVPSVTGARGARVLGGIYPC